MFHQPVLAPPADAGARRSFTVTYNELWIRRGMPWMIRKYGDGHWCVADGEPAYFASEAAAHADGRQWLETGRTA